MLPLQALLYPNKAWALAILVGVLTAACSASRSESSDPPKNDTGDDQSLVISFTDERTLTLFPSETVTLEARVSPPSGQTVQFELLVGEEGFDGFLTGRSGRVSQGGIARVELKAPSRPSIFIVRASLDTNHEARRVISVSAQGYGTISVEPRYTGSRPVEMWTASARAGMTCERLNNYFQDGPIFASGSSSLRLDTIPAGSAIAVSVRGDQLVSGCVTVTDLAADTVRTVIVPATDRPLNRSEGQFVVTLGVGSTTADFTNHLRTATSSGIASLATEGETDASLLLRFMHDELSPDQQAQFTAVVARDELAAVVEASFGSPKLLSERLADILGAAMQDIVSPDTFVGSLTLHETYCSFELQKAAGTAADIAGFRTGDPWDLAAESGDILVLGGTMNYFPLMWLTALASSRAEQEGGQAPLDALDSSIMCDTVAASLNASAESPLLDECEDECVASLCRLALSTIWSRLAEQGAEATLNVGAGGTATATDRARIASINGTWVGRIDDSSSSLNGPFSVLAAPE